MSSHPCSEQGCPEASSNQLDWITRRGKENRDKEDVTYLLLKHFASTKQLQLRRQSVTAVGYERATHFFHVIRRRVALASQFNVINQVRGELALRRRYDVLALGTL